MRLIRYRKMMRTTLVLATTDAAQASAIAILFENRFSNNPDVIPDTHHVHTARIGARV